MDKKTLDFIKKTCVQMALVENTKRYLEGLKPEDNLAIGSYANKVSQIIDPDKKDEIVQMFIEALESWQQHMDEKIKAL